MDLDGSLTLVSALDSHAALSTDANGNLYVAKLGGAVRLGYYVADAITHLVGPGSTFVPLAQGFGNPESVMTLLERADQKIEVERFEDGAGRLPP